MNSTMSGVKIVSDRAVVLQSPGITHPRLAAEMEKSGLIVENGCDRALALDTIVLIPAEDVSADQVKAHVADVMKRLTDSGEIVIRA